MTKFRILVFSEEGWLVAQCLEHDIATQAQSIPDLMYQIQSTLIGHILAAEEEGLSLESVPLAPDEFWRQWAEASAVRGESEYLPWTPAALLRQFSTPELRFA